MQNYKYRKRIDYPHFKTPLIVEIVSRYAINCGRLNNLLMLKKTVNEHDVYCHM